VKTGMARLAVALVGCWLIIAAAPAQTSGEPERTLLEPTVLQHRVSAGDLLPAEDRVPQVPLIAPLAGPDKAVGRYGGTLRLLGARARDTRLIYIYGYARLVGYTEDFRIEPDIALAVDVEEGRRFTFHLRPGHRWSDGAPFTSEDFRYYWDDVLNDPEVARFGPPQELLVDGEKPKVDFFDAHTVRYTWTKPNHSFLPALAASQPIDIFGPAHYLKKFHARYADPEELARLVSATGQRNWVALHYRMDGAYDTQNPDLPSLQPWILRTPPPSERFIFERNPYFHRIDERGQQLPYIDRVVLTVANSDLIPAKAASGEADLQGAYLSFGNYTFLKRAEDRSGFEVRRWLSGKGSRMTLFPNLNASDPVWRHLLREPDFRRALSVGINRRDINNAIFYGLATESNNTVLPQSPLFREEYRSRWTEYDPDLADKLLDDLGLAERAASGLRLLPDGRPMRIVVETAGEEIEQTDVLELVRDDWRRIGIDLLIKASQREVFRNRIKAGSTLVSVWAGLENGLPNADHSPIELAPSSTDQLHWPQWGMWAESNGQTGEAPDLAVVERLNELRKAWGDAITTEGRERIWHEMLEIWTDHVFTIGLVSSVDQIVVVSKRLRNVPKRGVYNFDPGSFFGIYRPDSFWFEQDTGVSQAGDGSS
jgi:peptide/nickel transport system substrate-binding protein